MSVSDVGVSVAHGSFIVVVPPDALRELRITLDRAMNTWEPHLQPPSLQRISDDLDKHMAQVGVTR